MASSSTYTAFGVIPWSTDPLMFNFSGLATEIRQMIWQGVANEPRVVTILPNATTSNRKTFTKPPILLYICRESRAFALVRLINIFPGARTPVYISPALDKVLLSTYQASLQPRPFDGLDLSRVKSLAILQEDMGLAPVNHAADLIAESCLRPFSDHVNDEQALAFAEPQPEWRVGSVPILRFFLDILFHNNWWNVRELAVLVMPPNTKKWSPTELNITIQKCMNPWVLNDAGILITQLRSMLRTRIDRQGEFVRLPYYLATAEPIHTPSRTPAIHGYSPALEDGLGFHHVWNKVEIHPNFKASNSGVRLYEAPESHGGDMAVRTRHWPVSGRNCKLLLRTMPLQWELLFQHDNLVNLEPPLFIDTMLGFNCRDKKRYPQERKDRFMEPSFSDTQLILARLYNDIDPFQEVDED